MGRCRSVTGIRQDLDPLVAEAQDHRDSFVAAMIVDDDDLLQAVTLIQHAFDGLGDHRFAVFGGYDHAYIHPVRVPD